jgi:hypothetical protein
MTGERRLVLVVGVGRSGTSLLTAILGALGLHVPQPEVRADETNPRGFGEPRWVVDFHEWLLRERSVTVNDSRPDAFAATYGAAREEWAERDLRNWLAGQLARGGTVVVKDPRTAWFLPLWRQCADALGVPASTITMLRRPPEVLASALTSYGSWQVAASRAAAWINVMLETERATRGTPRAFVAYDDLLADWAGEVARAGRESGIERLATVARRPDVDALVDPALHRNRAGWEDLDVPERVRTLADAVWEQLRPLAALGGDTAAVRAALDGSRGAYAALYGEAEAIAQSTTHAARRGAPSAGTSVRVRLARRVPLRYRRTVRRAVRRIRWR